MKSREFGTFAILFGAVALGFVLMGAPGLSASPAPLPAAASAPSPAAAGAPRAAASALPSFADLAEQVLPAVVSIEAVAIEKGGSQRGPGVNPFEYFFRNPGRPGEGDPGDAKPRDFRSESGGSGFVVSADGLVVTNNHVIDGATEVKVHLGDRDFKAEIKGTDSATDLALLKIDVGHPVPFLPLGDSERLRVGDWVMAIGNPLLLRQTVTTGVVSAKGRQIGLDRDTSFENFIQTDAAINRGNSGGPLVNLAGEVVGIATAMNWGAENIGFAVPVNTLRAVLPQLRDRGKVSRGYLGVNIQNLDFDRAQAFGLESADGALVVEVVAGTPAAKAGLVHGDVVFEVDGRQVKTTRDIIDYVSSKPPGESVKLSILRDGKRVEKTVKLEERPGEDDAVSRESERNKESGIEWLGLEYRDVNPALRQSHGIPAGAEGVWVSDVGATSPFVGEGLRPGDLIAEVNGQPVASSEAFERAVKATPSGKFLRLYVKRFDPRGDGNPFSFFAVTRVP